MKKTIHFSFMLAFIMTTIVLTGCKKDDIQQNNGNIVPYQTDLPSDKLNKHQALKEIKPVVQQFLNSQYDYLMAIDEKPKWNEYISAGGDELQSRIDNYREASYYNTYDKLIAYKSEFIYDEKGYVSSEYPSLLIRSGDLWILTNVYDKFSMTETPEGKSAQETNTPPSQGAVWYKEIILRKTGDKWTILSWKEDVLGIPHRWFKEKIRIVDEQSLESKAGTYNRVTSVMYAINHVFNPNSNYPNYSNYGGDCTNFVSQCLEAGGWTQITSGTNKWFHAMGYSSPPSSTYRSPSWTGASNLYAFLSSSSRVSSTPTSITSLNVGDVVQRISNGSAHHTMIVTRRSTVNGLVKIEAHYRNASGYSPQSYANITSLSSSSAKFWKIANSY
jgi:hypothetical protein